MCYVKLSFALTQFQPLDIKLQCNRTYRCTGKFIGTSCTSLGLSNSCVLVTFVNGIPQLTEDLEISLFYGLNISRDGLFKIVIYCNLHLGCIKMKFYKF